MTPAFIFACKNRIELKNFDKYKLLMQQLARCLYYFNPSRLTKFYNR